MLRICTSAGFTFACSSATIVWKCVVELNGTAIFLPLRSATVLIPDPFLATMSVALENVRLFNETKEALERQTATAEVLRVISSSPSDLDPVYRTILERITRLCESQIGALFLFDGERLHAAAMHGMKLGTSVVVAPLIWEGRGIGSLTMMRQEVDGLRERENALLRTFADQAVIAIQNARLFNETKEALEQQTATAEVLQVIGSSVADTAPVFEKILESCKHLFATEQLGIFLVGDDNQVHAGAWRGSAFDAISRTFPLPLDQTMTGRVIRERRTIHIPDADKTPSAPPAVRGVVDLIGNCAIAWAPMLWEDRGVGSLAVLRQPPKPFTDKELALLKTFGDQAVIAIQNSRMSVFGAPVPLADHCESAVRAAQEMVELIELFNLERQAALKPTIRIGIGIASGDMVAGYAGTNDRATYTCIGDIVNLASRLETHTKIAERTILIDPATRSALGDDFTVEALGPVPIKGKATAVDVFSVDPEKGH